MSARIRLMAIFLLVVVSACKKDKKTEETPEPEQTTTNPPPNFRLIDSSNTQIIRASFNPDKFASSTLDVDGDQVADIRLNVIYSYGASGIRIHDTKIETLNNTTFILCDSVYVNQHLDNCNSTTTNVMVNENFPKVLSYNDSLKITARWKAGNFHLTYYYEIWKNFPVPGECYQSVKSQNWPDQSWRYIGIKVNGHLGWLKMYSEGNRFNNFSEFALEL